MGLWAPHFLGSMGHDIDGVHKVGHGDGDTSHDGSI
jgi:hypothetical protein